MSSVNGKTFIQGDHGRRITAGDHNNKTEDQAGGAVYLAIRSDRLPRHEGAPVLISYAYIRTDSRPDGQKKFFTSFSPQMRTIKLDSLLFPVRFVISY